MYIHLGEEIVIRSKDIVAIIDRHLLQSSTIINEFITGQQKKRQVVEVTEGDIKSIVVTKEKIYLSSLSSATLKRRAETTGELVIGEDQD
ncbi:extracellular matrix regulator RemB [Bacillus marinisedimentorum]|uniref:extracellular matrix regulator RemB n=1 Tax=Bacillus marinisedimentorum TaxID=1821260 RepID=UPI000871BF2F|nr:extracellular matrix/biofilm biosynthesis regulator RemA family protein [Bacillus marinisedimentorum]